MSVLISIATYNEIENLPALVDEIQKHVDDADILIIDDNSPDGTGAWCDEKSKSVDRFRCIHREGKLGLGTATIRGMQEAIDNGYDFVVNMDADFSHHPRYLPQLIDGMKKEVDCMVGTRYAPGGGVEGWPWTRRLSSRMVNTFATTMLGLPVSDCSGSFRCYRCSVLQKIDLNAIESKGYSFFEEILWHLKNAGARFGEIPIVFVNRELGQSKVSIKEAIKAGWMVTSLGLRAFWSGDRKKP